MCTFDIFKKEKIISQITSEEMVLYCNNFCKVNRTNGMSPALLWIYELEISRWNLEWNILKQISNNVFVYLECFIYLATLYTVILGALNAGFFIQNPVQESAMSYTLV